MFPQLNKNLNSLSAQSLGQYQSPTQNITPSRNYQILSSILNNTNNSYKINNLSNNNNINIFSRQLNDSSYGSNKWILNKIDQNSSRITNNYKKDYSPLIQAKPARDSLEIPQNSLDLQQQTNNSCQVRRRRKINLKQIFALDTSNNQNISQNDLMDDQQPRQQISDIPSNYTIQESPLRQRKINRNMLFIQSNKSQEFDDQYDSEKNFVEQQNRVKKLIRNRQGSMQGLNQDQRIINLSNNMSDDQILNKSTIQIGITKQPSYASFFSNRTSNNQIKQTSIQVIESEKDNDSSQISTQETEESLYNFKLPNQKMIFRNTSHKGILKNSTENYIQSPFKKSQKKQVSFNIIKKIF
ncbi:hypothetical protein TTHERM_00329970 (macronuclear) [Tetrahymena thermophila SB210]|uniref:Uncharacterized protein n=1 Tax=Tetrahymena thermophila (strain SB210) TaxID=312017 RepID=I7MJJ5_TETTS|nr:hypothetical protein TTHERM_00329970 [Tetrahymena thermophila SB210]EAS06317.1 hypothetical protein TTHERM_00329970 [Tetrahymena thermophila SB210]|eukprot:XP_001026562.1 hypothetical protein TTHERM_00329970 [Tetrahymena thermophila SB210]